jgi:hypothetical protein
MPIASSVCWPLSCTRFAVIICPALLKVYLEHYTCWNCQISSEILRQIRKRVLISFATQVATNFASEIFAWLCLHF